MKSIAFITLLLIFLIGVPLVSAVPNNSSISSIQISDLIQAEEGFSASSAGWSPDGKYLLVRSYKSISMFEGITKHYLVDTENKTFGEIDYGITEEESNFISPIIGWLPSGGKIYFTVFKRGGPGNYGGNCIICNPDGTSMRALGSQNITTLSEVIDNLGGEHVFRELKFSPDSNKLAFEYEHPGNYQGSLWIENIDGSDSFELRSGGRKLVWYNSTTVFFLSRDSSLLVTDDRGNSIQAFFPDEGEKYRCVSFSPDKQKMTFPARSVDFEYYNYISNIDGSNLIKSEIGVWQPNSSAMLLNKNGSLYILEGKEHSQRLFYEGNATKAQWFPDGTKILFLENKNKIYSIDSDGTNVSFIADVGLTTHHIWELYGDTEGWEQISISPTGDIIAFTSALYPNGEIIEFEPSLKKAKNIAAPLFIVDSDGTNLTRLTPAIKGTHGFLDGWSPDGKMLTVDYIHFSENGNDHGSSYLFSLDGTDISEGWKEMPVSQIINNDNPAQIANTRYLNEKIVLNESTSNETEDKQVPSFQFLQFISCLMSVWILLKRQRFSNDK